MDVEYLRKALKLTWLNYYRANREWLVRLGIWVNYKGARRPSASFILGTLSVAEPQLIQLLPLVVDLSSNPDRIVVALGLNFNPEDELEALEKSIQAESTTQSPPKMLLSTTQPALEPKSRSVAQPMSQPVIQPVVSPVVQITEPVERLVERSVEPSGRQSHQPRRASDSQPAQPSAKLPAQPFTQPPTQPKSTRRMLDTAQLETQELPDRI